MESKNKKSIKDKVIFGLIAVVAVTTIILGGGQKDSNNGGENYEEALKLYEEGKYEESYNKIKKEKTIKAYNLKGNIYMQMGKVGDAIEFYTEGLKKDKDNIALLTNRGNAYFNVKKYGKAEKDFEKVIKLDPENALAYLNQGSVYAHQEKFFESLNMLNKAQELGNPDALEYIDNVNKMSQEHLNKMYEKGELDVVENKD